MKDFDRPEIIKSVVEDFFLICRSRNSHSSYRYYNHDKAYTKGMIYVLRKLLKSKVDFRYNKNRPHTVTLDKNQHTLLKEIKKTLDKDTKK